MTSHCGESMALSGKDEIKTQISTREGVYKVQSMCEYSRPTRTAYSAQQGNMPVKVSFVCDRNNEEKLCFNVGRELYVYNYRGVSKPVDLTKYVDKRAYKGTYPSCHDFNAITQPGSAVSTLSHRHRREGSCASSLPDPSPSSGANTTLSLSMPNGPITATNGGSASTTNDENCSNGTTPGPSLLLLVGFSAGQVQLIDPVRKDLSKLFNDERLIDKTRVTCLRWVPGSTQLFLVSHASGQLYLYKEELPCSPTPPHYQLFKAGQGFSVYTCKTKSTRNPLYRWVIGDGALNEFAFSPDHTYLATVSQDGFMRCIHYDTMELVGCLRSYFGGLLCVCWSPDGKYVVTGGEDDLVTVWSFTERRVAARGQSHKSWVNVVAFDPYYHGLHGSLQGGYRFGSVGQDTQLCLWDLTEDVLKQSGIKSRSSQQTLVNGGDTKPDVQTSKIVATPAANNQSKNVVGDGSTTLKGSSKANNQSASSGKQQQQTEAWPKSGTQSPTAICPKLDEVPMLEPHVCKKIAAERVTSLVFRDDCFVTACQEGYVYTWARPGRPTPSSPLQGGPSPPQQTTPPTTVV